MTAAKQGTLADISSLVEESLSVSGVLLGKTMGRSRASSPPLPRRVAERWPIWSSPTRRRALGDGHDSVHLRGHARTCAASPGTCWPAVTTYLAGHAGRLHHSADAAVLPGVVAAHVQADLQTSTGLFDRVFEYLDLPIEIEEARRVTLDP